MSKAWQDVKRYLGGKPWNRYLGVRGERLALRHLRRKYYYIWQVNWRARGGEIDIVATEGDTLVFVEVKTRSAAVADVFDPFDAVDEQKARRLRAAAEAFHQAFQPQIRRKRLRRTRFDIVAVVVLRTVWWLPLKASVIHLKDALAEG